MPSTPLFPQLSDYISSLDSGSISHDRKQVLQPLMEYLRGKFSKGQPVRLNFICTHNSRRSQFAQVWAQVVAAYFGVRDIHCYSGGTEVTAFNSRAVRALERAGLHVSRGNGENPVYDIHFSDKYRPLQCFSKLYDHPENPKADFAAVMTCSHADENCPFLPGSEKRIPLNFEDPKAYDGTPQETEKYDERCRQIATEMLFVFTNTAHLKQ